MDAIRLPIWLRIVVVAGLVALAASASLFGYRWYVQPVTLSIAVGSLDGEAPRVVSALASRLAEVNAPVRLKVVETTGALESASEFAAARPTSRWSGATSATFRMPKPSLSWLKRSRCLSHRRDRRSRTSPG
ncbi:hypothetical protein [Bradyrhizobium sp. BRP22]|uniref:hypothetical protein n=1 Tax=Bradyrhizobium sp. BRP22 TaxID=2793821 RepID=UPI0031FC7D6C